MDLITQKKFRAAIIAVAVSSVLVLFGGLSVDDALKISAPIGLYIVSQGIADHGKEKAIAEAAVREMANDENKN